MWAKLLLLFFVFSLLFKTDHSFDQDLGRHLKLGEIIWQTKNVPLTNLFSYTYPDFPFINSHWLFEVLVYLGQQTLGLQTVLVLKIISILLTVWLVLKNVPKNQYLLLPIGFIFLHVLRERTELRPEIFSFLLTALTIYILEKYDKTKSRLIYLLPIVQLIWVNAHIYFIVGLILQGIFLVHFTYAYLRLHPKGVKLKLLIIIFLLSVVASLLNPSTIKGFLNPLLYGTNYGYTIVENQTIFLLENIGFRDPNFLFAKIAAIIILLSIATAVFKKRLEVKNLGLASVGLVLALMNVRSLPYLALISLSPVLQNFGIPKSKLWAKLLIMLTVPILLYESFLYLNGDYYKYTDSGTEPKLIFKESAKNALDFVLKNDLPQPIFNNFDIGSYITYKGWPKYRIFVDGRPGEYPKEFFQNVYIPMQSSTQKFAEINKQHGFKTIIFSHTDQTPWGKAFLSSVLKDTNWKTVYIDDFMIVLVNDLGTQGETLEAIDLSMLNGSDYKFTNHRSYLNLGIFLLNSGYKKSAETFIAKSLQAFPQSPLGNALFGAGISNKFFW